MSQTNGMERNKKRDRQKYRMFWLYIKQRPRKKTVGKENKKRRYRNKCLVNKRIKKEDEDREREKEEMTACFRYVSDLSNKSKLE